MFLVSFSDVYCLFFSCLFYDVGRVLGGSCYFGGCFLAPLGQRGTSREEKNMKACTGTHAQECLRMLLNGQCTHNGCSSMLVRGQIVQISG